MVRHNLRQLLGRPSRPHQASPAPSSFLKVIPNLDKTSSCFGGIDRDHRPGIDLRVASKQEQPLIQTCDTQLSNFQLSALFQVAQRKLRSAPVPSVSSTTTWARVFTTRSTMHGRKGTPSWTGMVPSRDRGPTKDSQLKDHHQSGQQMTQVTMGTSQKMSEGIRTLAVVGLKDTRTAQGVLHSERRGLIATAPLRQ